MKPGFIPSAPVSPVSSSRVKTHSIGPCSMSLLSRIASSMAQPIPSSAPNVVPLALSHSPSIYVWIASFLKSKSMSTSFSHTMSMWLCRITVFLFSKPGVAPLRMITLPVSSTLVSRPWSSPNFFKYSIIFSSCFEGRGIWLIFANCSNTQAGINSLLFIINSILCVLQKKSLSLQAQTELRAFMRKVTKNG